MKRAAAMLLLVGCGASAGCTSVERPVDAATIAEQYGVAGAASETVSASAGALQGTLVPITMADGRQAHLFVPLHQSRDVEAVYLRDDQGLHPIRLNGRSNRDEMVRAPALVVTPSTRQIVAKRSWEREVLIVAGSSGAGAVIGGLAAGKKGAGVGAAAGGVGGLVYDLITRRRD